MSPKSYAVASIGGRAQAVDSQLIAEGCQEHFTLCDSWATKLRKDAGIIVRVLMAMPELHNTTLCVELRSIIGSQNAINTPMISILEGRKRRPKDAGASLLAIGAERKHGTGHPISLEFVVRCVHSSDRDTLGWRISPIGLARKAMRANPMRSEEHTSELQSRQYL